MPLYYCALQALITQVWNPCAPFLLYTVEYYALWGSDNPGAEPLRPFTTLHCGSMITQVWNPCALSLLCTVGSDYPSVEPLCPYTTEQC